LACAMGQHAYTAHAKAQKPVPEPPRLSRTLSPNR
jgi:hypothetical protein